MSATMMHSKDAPALQLVKESHEQPLRDCVTSALEAYFSQLSGHPPTNVYRLVLEEMEQPLLQTVLKYAGGNQTRAAEILGLNRGTLRKKLKQYGLDQ